MGGGGGAGDRPGGARVVEDLGRVEDEERALERWSAAGGVAGAGQDLPACKGDRGEGRWPALPACVRVGDAACEEDGGCERGRRRELAERPAGAGEDEGGAVEGLAGLAGWLA